MEIYNNYFEEINLDLKGRIIFLDLDGTLVPDSGLSFDAAVLRQIEKLKAVNRIFLCTNSNNKIRNGQIEKTLGLFIVTHDHKKPSPRVLQTLGLSGKPNNLSVIGDKYLTDGIFAKNIGAEFIKVKRKISGKEDVFIKLINFIDDCIWKLIA